MDPGPLAIELNSVLWEAAIVTFKKVQKMVQTDATFFTEIVRLSGGVTTNDC